MTFKLATNTSSGKRLKALIYGRAGCGKTIAATTLLKIPNLQVCVIACENNALPAIEQGINIHNIDLKPKQLVIANIARPSYLDADLFIDNISDEMYKNIVSASVNFKGFCALTGEACHLGNIFNWESNRVLFFDGLTQFDASCQGRGKKISEQNKTLSDPRAAFYGGQEALLGYLYKITDQTNCHCVFLGHQTVSDETLVKKHKLEKKVNPGVGTKSVIDRFLGRYNNVLYMRYNAQKKTYVFSVAEDDTYTIYRGIDLKKCKEQGLNLDNLPADFSSDIYSFFDPIEKAAF